MKATLRRVGIQWEAWHGFRRGLAANVEAIGVRESIAAMILRHANEPVTRKHYIKPPVEAVSAMRQLSEIFSKLPTPQSLPHKCSPTSENGPTDGRGTMAPVKASAI